MSHTRNTCHVALTIPEKHRWTAYAFMADIPPQMVQTLSPFQTTKHTHVPPLHIETRHAERQNCFVGSMQFFYTSSQTTKTEIQKQSYLCNMRHFTVTREELLKVAFVQLCKFIMVIHEKSSVAIYMYINLHMNNIYTVKEQGKSLDYQK